MARILRIPAIAKDGASLNGQVLKRTENSRNTARRSERAADAKAVRQRGGENG